jgi:glycosyltransferase involved in cell wall biosynthesis
MMELMHDKQMKRCLVISYGPVPTPDNQVVEGGGMRAWGLADGLTAHGIDVTVGVNASFPQKLTKHEGIKLVNWSEDADFVRLMNSFDAVIISYCMGSPSVFVADHINDNVQLILDAYVPIYIEVSARDSKDIETEYTNYMADIARHNHVLRRGDYFLYANSSQEMLYSGVLSALGVINPSTYRKTLLLKTPFGIHRTAAMSRLNPYTDLGIGKNDFVVLWFGGIYPWFRIEEYLAAIQTLATDKTIKFVFVGGKNPFNPNPDFSRQYDVAVDFADKNKLTNTQVFFVDWVDFQDRINWFAHADVIVSLNQPGEENKYSWRTRVMDYVWGEVVTISNGGDPLSEEMIGAGAAIRLPELSAKALSDTLLGLKSNPKLLQSTKKHVQQLKQNYFWDVVTTQLARVITEGSLPYSGEAKLRRLANVPSAGPAGSLPNPAGKVRKLAGLPFKVVRKIRQKGVIRTARITASVVKTQLKNRRPAAREPQFVFIASPINNTGAPVVLLQILEEYVQRYGAKRIRLITSGVDEAEQKLYLRKLGIHAEQAVFGIGFRFIRLQLALQKDDFVLMNTTAIYDTYRDFILLWLRNGRLNHAYWFIHEDIAQLPIIHKEFLDKRNLAELADLAKKRSLSLLFPSQRTAQEYEELIGITNTQPVRLHVEVPDQYKTGKQLADFDTLDFFLSGTSTDGRKGQLLALSAFQAFLKGPYAKHPDAYRPFKLNLVAIGETDYISQQVRWIADSTLKDRVAIHKSLPKDQALQIAYDSNVVICCSLNETFGLYIAEGMLMGHVVLRNNCAGMSEQLLVGKNGYFIDHTDIEQFAGVIEQLLNKKTTSNEQLLAMSRKSQDIINRYSDTTYLSQIESGK